MIFFFYGEDSFRAKNKIDAIKDKFKASIDSSGQNIISLDGELLSLAKFFDAVKANGFLATKKLVLIKNIFNNKKLADWQDDLIAYLQTQKDSVEENYLIFWQTDKPDARTALYKALKKFKYSEEFAKLSPAKLEAWLKNKINKANKNISQANLNLLLTYVGDDLWLLNNELDKLISFAEAEEISAEDIKLLVSAKSNDNIFHLVEALGKKDKKQASLLLNQQLKTGANALYLLSMIIRQYRLLLKIKLLSHDLNNSFALAQALKIHQFVAEKTLAQSKLYSVEQLKNIYKSLLNLEEKLKSTTGEPEALFLSLTLSL